MLLVSSARWSKKAQVDHSRFAIDIVDFYILSHNSTEGNTQSTFESYTVHSFGSGVFLDWAYAIVCQKEERSIRRNLPSKMVRSCFAFSGTETYEKGKNYSFINLEILGGNI